MGRAKIPLTPPPIGQVHVSRLSEGGILLKHLTDSAAYRHLPLISPDLHQVLTGHIRSTQFPITRGTYQGCPRSPLLFALSLEPLTQAIHQSSTFTPISIEGNLQYISLDADNMLLPIDNVNCLQCVLDIFNHFSSISGCKIN